MTNFSGKPLSPKTGNAACGGPQGGGMDSRRNGVAEVHSTYLAEMASPTVPVGFKPTEVGVIPEDWEVISIGEALLAKSLVDQMDGNHGELYPKSHEFSSFGVPYIGATDFYSGNVDYKNCKYLPIQRAKKFKKGIAKNGDILFAHNATVGPVALVETELDFIIISTTATYYRCNKDEIDNVYLASYFRSETFVKQFSSVMSQSTRNQVPILAQRKFLLVLPPVQEQTAIANALSDVDALIGELEKLIAKKQAIKTATMQQLLTGRTRLPQFALREDGTPTNSSGTALLNEKGDAGTGGPKGEGQDGLRKSTKPSELGEIPEDWAVKTYGEVFTFLSTSTSSRADLSEDGDFGYVHYGDIHTEWNNKLDLNKERLPRISKSIVSSAFVMDGDLIMADASEDYEGIGKTVEVFNVGEKQIVAGLHTFLLRDKEKVLADGFRGYLHSIPAVKSSFDRLATGMKVYGISKNNLSSVCIPVPSLEEQTAIATILSDMDAEIQALEQRLGKTRKIKQGMMQELLTGKTRLPFNKD